MNAKHILIVDSDAAARTELGRELTKLGYHVGYASTAEAASFALARITRPDLALVEVDLPDCDGRELVARLRRRGALLPVILVADSASEDDVVWGLDAGADDFFIRPLRIRELAARIRAQFRATILHEENDLKVGILTFRPATRLAVHPFLSHPVRLTEKEAALLGRLCRAEGRPVSRQTLLREVWGYSPNVSSHTVETHIYRLRRKIEGGDGTPPILLSEGGGYRLATGESALDAPLLDVPAPRVATPAWAALPMRAPARVLAAAE